MNRTNLDQTTEEIYMQVIQNVLKKNMKDKIEEMHKTKEPPWTQRIQQYKTQILYAGIITGIVTATTAGLMIYYFYMN